VVGLQEKVQVLPVQVGGIELTVTPVEQVPGVPPAETVMV
jgi:hypothetical protein